MLLHSTASSSTFRAHLNLACFLAVFLVPMLLGAFL